MSKYSGMSDRELLVELAQHARPWDQYFDDKEDLAEVIFDLQDAGK